MSKRFQVSAPLFDFRQLLRSSFHRNSLWWNGDLPVFKLLGHSEWKYCVDQFDGEHHLDGYSDSNDTRIFWFQWYKNILEFFWVCRTIPTRRDTNLRAQLWGPRNSSMWSFPEEIYVNTCFFCAGGKRTIGLLLNQKAAVILDRAGGDPLCHTYLAYIPETVIYVPGIRG